MQTIHLKGASIACVADEMGAEVFHIARGVMPFCVLAHTEEEADAAVEAHVFGTAKQPSGEEQQPGLF